jgi:UDP-N-acetylmuramyl pentapeptide phosphotransferase/UDP-N-acetylglucosamine-1-phosphate transferase
VNSSNIIFAAASIASFLTLAVLLRSRLSSFILDHPNRANVMHATPIPRIGGLAMLIAAFFVSAAVNPPGWLLPPLIGAIALAAISFLDDRLTLGALLRLAAHITVAASLCLWWYQGHLLGINREGGIHSFFFWVEIVILVGIALAITWCTNLYNFMDGADGLAGGMALFGFGAYAIAVNQLAVATDAFAIAHISAIISGAALGFLFFNFPPAKVFMGDAGSIPLGFLAATLGIQGTLSHLWPWWFPLLVFSPFIVDATVTLIKRIVRFEKIWEAHRKHYYHRLILGGWSHRRTALAYYALMILCGASALFARNLEKPAPILAFWVVTYTLLPMFLEWRFEQKNRRKNKNQ